MNIFSYEEYGISFLSLMFGFLIFKDMPPPMLDDEEEALMGRKGDEEE